MPVYPKPPAPVTAPAQPIVPQVPVPSPKEITMSETVAIPAAQLSQLQSQLAELQAANTAARQEAEAAKTRELIKSGAADSVIRQHQAELAEAKTRAAKFAASSALSQALASHPLDVGSAEQLSTLFANDIQADPSGDGSFTCRSKDYRTVQDFVASKLAHEDYAHFLAKRPPASPSVNRPSPTTPELPTEPQTFGQFAIMAHLDRQAKRDAAAPTDPRIDPSKPLGLKGTAAGTPALGPLGIRFR
jgi:hypothetical protein